MLFSKIKVKKMPYPLPAKERLRFAKDRQPVFEGIVQNRDMDAFKQFFSYGFSPNETFDLGSSPRQEEAHQTSFLSMILWRKALSIFDESISEHKFEDLALGHMISIGLDFKIIDKESNSFSSPLLAFLSKMQMKAMFERGLSPNYQDSEGYSILAALCGVDTPSEQKGVIGKIALVLEKGGNPNLFSYEEQSPLRIAIETCFSEAVEMLCENGAFIEIIDSDGFDLKTIAAERFKRASNESPEIVARAKSVHATICHWFAKKNL